jgi:hypothetical protein
VKKTLAALACFTAVTVPATSHAAAIIDFAATTEIAGDNDFESALNGLGLTRYATLGSSIVLDAGTTIRFDFLGSESGYDDTFFTISGPALSFTETTAWQDNFLAPILIGTAAFGPGSLATLLNFSSSAGNPATVGLDGFGIFLGPNQLSGAAVDTFYFGYDDQITGDDDYDDFIVRATLVAVPEPMTWALLLAGFGLAGAALRRRRQPLRLRAMWR